jgi:hypothetical protein
MGDEDDEDDSDEESMDEDEHPSSSGEPGPSSSGEPVPASSGEPSPSSSGDADVAVTTPEQVEPSLGLSITSSHVEVVKTVVTETEVDDTVLGVHSSEKVTITTETLMTVSTVTTNAKEEAVTGVAIEGDSLDASTIEVAPASPLSNGHSSEKGTAVPDSSMAVEINPSGEDTARVSNGEDRTDTSTVEFMPAYHDQKVNEGSEVVQDEPLNFSNYQSANDLEVRF